MPTSLQFALSNPIAGQEEEFNRWYGGEHLTHGVLTPGVTAGQRFKRVDGPWPAGKHEFLMIWEMDDPALALRELAQARHGEKMPISPAIDMNTVQPPTMWRRATVRSVARVVTDTSERKSVVLALMNARIGEDDSFAAEILGHHLAVLADANAVICAEFLTLADEQIRGNARKFRFGILLELYDEAVALEVLRNKLPALPHLDQQSWLAPVFRPLGHRLTTAQARVQAHS